MGLHEGRKKGGGEERKKRGRGEEGRKGGEKANRSSGS